MGEVPVMEEERTRREASVLRYKEKRQTRLFAKKIRYQVRKLNADKRPRLKVCPDYSLHYYICYMLFVMCLYTRNLDIENANFGLFQGRFVKRVS